mgnify:CR=1 FL=1
MKKLLFITKIFDYNTVNAFENGKKLKFYDSAGGKILTKIKFVI